MWTSAMRLPSLVSCFILESLLARKSNWPSLERVTREYSGSSRVLDDEPVIVHVLLAAHALKVGLPALPVGRIGEHEVELAGGEGVVGEGGVLRAAHDVVGGFPLALEQEVGFADGVGLGVDLLTEEVGGHLLAPILRELLQHVLGHGQHAAGTAGSVVEEIGAVVDLIGDGEKDQLRHELDGVARGEVLSGLLVVLLVEAPDQFLENGAHGVVVETGMPNGAIGVHDRFRAQVDVGRGELFDERAQGVGPGELGDLIAELEVVEYVLHAGREPVEVVLEVGPELLSVGPGPEVVEGELGGVVECLARFATQRSFCSTTPCSSSHAFMFRTACLVGSRTASRRRRTVMGRMTSRYLPRT